MELLKPLLDMIQLDIKKMYPTSNGCIKVCVVKEGDNEIQLVFGDDPTNQNYVIFECKMDLYLIGDLKFLFMVMGQSGYSAHYCLYCRLKSAQWRTIYKNQKKINCEADFWSIQSLTQEALMIQQGNSNKVGMGIKEPPIWDFIPVHKILVPILHILLGLGNYVLAMFWQWVDE